MTPNRWRPVRRLFCPRHLLRGTRIMLKPRVVPFGKELPVCSRRAFTLIEMLVVIAMNRIVWPCPLCLLASCSPHQDAPANPTKPSEQTDSLRVARDKKKTTAASAGDGINRVTTVAVPEGGSPVAARVDAKEPFTFSTTRPMAQSM